MYEAFVLLIYSSQKFCQGVTVHVYRRGSMRLGNLYKVKQWKLHRAKQPQESLIPWKLHRAKQPQESLIPKSVFMSHTAHDYGLLNY